MHWAQSRRFLVKPWKNGTQFIWPYNIRVSNAWPSTMEHMQRAKTPIRDYIVTWNKNQTSKTEFSACNAIWTQTVGLWPGNSESSRRNLAFYRCAFKTSVGTWFGLTGQANQTMIPWHWKKPMTWQRHCDTFIEWVLCSEIWLKLTIAKRTMKKPSGNRETEAITEPPFASCIHWLKVTSVASAPISLDEEKMAYKCRECEQDKLERIIWVHILKWFHCSRIKIRVFFQIWPPENALVKSIKRNAATQPEIQMMTTTTGQKNAEIQIRRKIHAIQRKYRTIRSYEAISMVFFLGVSHIFGLNTSIAIFLSISLAHSLTLSLSGISRSNKQMAAKAIITSKNLWAV